MILLIDFESNKSAFVADAYYRAFIKDTLDSFFPQCVRNIKLNDLFQKNQFLECSAATPAFYEEIFPFHVNEGVCITDPVVLAEIADFSFDILDKLIAWRYTVGLFHVP